MGMGVGLCSRTVCVNDFVLIRVIRESVLLANEKAIHGLQLNNTKKELLSSRAVESKTEFIVEGTYLRPSISKSSTLAHNHRQATSR